MRHLVQPLFACLLLTSAVAAEETAPHRVTRPEWAVRPTGEQMYNALSHSARVDEPSGWALIRCDVTDKGLLKDCIALAESSGHYEFGKTALRLAPIFRLKPATRDGKPTAGGRILIPLVWAMPGKGMPRLSYAPGQPSFLLKPLTERKPGAIVIPCPTAGDRQTACEAIQIYWREAPSLEETSPIVLQSGQSSGASTVYCQLVAGKPLQNCQMEGERGSTAQVVVSKTLAKLGTPTQMDGTPVTSGVVAIVYDWPTLTTTAKAVVADSATKP